MHRECQILVDNYEEAGCEPTDFVTRTKGLLAEHRPFSYTRLHTAMSRAGGGTAVWAALRATAKAYKAL